MRDENLTEAEAIADIVRGGEPTATIKFKAFGGGQMVALPPGYRVESLEQFQAAPDRTKGKTKVSRVASLIAYSQRFNWPVEMAAHAYLSSRSLVVTYNANHPMFDTSEITEAGGPGWGDHVCDFTASIDPTFQLWISACKDGMGQVALARFLEERVRDVVKPAGAEIMDLVLNFDAAKSSTFKSSTRLQNGDRQFLWTEETRGTGAITVPEEISIYSPVLDGGEHKITQIKLRYRIDEGRLVFRLEILDLDQILRAAFQAEIARFCAAAPEGHALRDIDNVLISV